MSNTCTTTTTICYLPLSTTTINAFVNKYPYNVTL